VRGVGIRCADEQAAVDHIGILTRTAAHDITKKCTEVSMSKARVVAELWQFMRESKKFWLAPILITLVVLGLLLVIAKSSAIAPFIYTLF
jgi:hypothetical protein